MYQNVDKEKEMEIETPSIWEGIGKWFSTGKEYEEMAVEEFEYERELYDTRIESYLDENFEDMVEEFGILDEVSLEVRTEKVSVLEGRTDGLLDFVGNVDKEVADLEERADKLEKLVGKK